MSTLISDHVDVQEAIRAEQALAPGLYEVRFFVSEPVVAQDLKEAKVVLIQEGIKVRNVFQKKTKGGLWYIAVQYEKPAPSEAVTFLPLALIPLIAFGLTAVLVGIGIFKMEDITNNIGKILLIGGGILIVSLALLRKPLEHATEIAAKRYL